jgi:uncharacterized RDD family membrane protein YckC
MAFCASCGKELPAGVTFCPNCGAPVGLATPTQPQEAAAPMSGIDALTKDSKAQEHWGKRLAAIVIDAVVVYAVLWIIAIPLIAVSIFTGGFAGFAFIAGTFSWVFGLIFVLYFAIAETTFGASLGKRLMGLKAVSKTGGNPNFAEAFIRNLSKINWLLLLLDVIVGLAVSKGYSQKYSDKLMGTSVTSTK